MRNLLIGRRGDGRHALERGPGPVLDPEPSVVVQLRGKSIIYVGRRHSEPQIEPCPTHRTRIDTCEPVG